jgi:predicted amidophosphoribosyltransferase
MLSRDKMICKYCNKREAGNEPWCKECGEHIGNGIADYLDGN